MAKTSGTSQRSIFRTKTIEASIAETGESEYQLKKRLGALDLTVFGIGVIIGAGIFTLTGRAAATVAGPSIVISFVIAAVACGLAALCYAEFASTVPVSGSAYTFSYATLGEFVAWIIGWDLLLELLLGASVVAQGWSAYLGVFLGKLGIKIPEAVAYGSAFDLPALLLVIVLTILVAVGIKESMRVNLVLVAIKLFVVLFVIIAGIGFINAANYSPFIPPAKAASASGGSVWTAPLLQTIFGISPTTFGVMGIFAGASLVFFAYIGFDVVATTAEEARNPSVTCRSALSGRWLSARSSTSRSPWSSRGCCPTTRSRRRPRWRPPSNPWARGLRHPHLSWCCGGSHHRCHDPAHRSQPRRLCDEP